ncbi:MAG: DUF4189 domain-containing protein [Cardiobacteriaceae bacterium]|nr:DUF4189 domain-containing protein [Cardiobacteriaceae bacterium]
MKNPLLLLSLCLVLAAHANPYQAGSQQWHEYNAMGAQMMQEMNQRIAAEAAAQRQSGQMPETVPHHLRPQWHPADNHGAIAVGFNPNASPNYPENPPGVAAFHEHPDLHVAEERARYACFDSGATHPDQCQILVSFRNMCGAAAYGRLRDGHGVRFYPSAGIPAHDKAQAEEQALAHCRADSAIQPASCTLSASGCSNPGKTLR